MNIALIANDAKVVMTLKRGLEEFGLTVTGTFSLEDGLELILDNHPDILIVDEPDADNSPRLDLYRQLLSYRNETGLLILTNKNADLLERPDGIRFFDYLTKPFSFRNLLTGILSIRNKQLEFVWKSGGI